MSDSNESTSKVIKIVVAAVILLVAGIALFLQFRTPPAELVGMWFYDVEGKKLIIVPDTIPPTTVSGAETVKAYVTGCGSCKDESKLTIRYLEKFTPEMTSQLKDAGITSYAALASEPLPPFEGRLVKKAPDVEWVQASSDAGQALIATAATCADGSTPIACNGPDSK